MISINVDGEVYRAVRAAACGRALNHGLRDLLGLPPTEAEPNRAEQDAAASHAGDLAELIKAGMLSPGDRLLATNRLPYLRPVATVTAEGHLRDQDGAIHQGPAALIACQRGATFAPYGWQCLSTADGTRLATLVQRLAALESPGLAPDAPGALAELINAGLLTPGDRLHLPIHRRLGNGRGTPAAVAEATVTDDGWFLMADGARYPNPSSAAAAARGNPTGAWKAWRAPDGQRLLALRDQADRQRRPR